MRTPTRLLVYTGGSRMVCEHSGVWALFTENTEMYSGQQAPSPWQLYLLHPQILCARASLQDPLQSAFPCLCLATSSRGTYHNHQCDAFRRLSLLQAGDRAWVGAHLLSPGVWHATSAISFENGWKLRHWFIWFDFFSPAQRKSLHHQWIVHKIENVSNLQPRNNRVQTQIFWVLKGKNLDLEKEKNKNPLSQRFSPPMSRVHPHQKISAFIFINK